MLQVATSIRCVADSNFHSKQPSQALQYIITCPPVLSALAFLDRLCFCCHFIRTLTFRLDTFAGSNHCSLFSFRPLLASSSESSLASFIRAICRDVVRGALSRLGPLGHLSFPRPSWPRRPSWSRRCCQSRRCCWPPGRCWPPRSRRPRWPRWPHHRQRTPLPPALLAALIAKLGVAATISFGFMALAVALWTAFPKKHDKWVV